jgi:D-alanine--poly(phosphoribitol) ligase subunit 2
MSVSEIVLKELEKYTGTDQVHKDLNVDLFGEKLLDSLASVELILALSEDFGIDVSPGEIDRELWATPQKIIGYFEERLNNS